MCFQAFSFFQRLRSATLVMVACAMLTSCLPMNSTSPSGSSTADSLAAAQSQTDTWVRSLTGLSATEQGLRAEKAWRNAENPEMLRNRAAFLLATRPNPQSLAAQQHLANLYSRGTHAEKVEMERMLMADLLTADSPTLKSLGRGVLRVQETTFPWSLTVWFAAQRNLLPDSAQAIARLSNAAYYADPRILGLSPGSTGGTVKPGTIVTAMLLPLSGPYGTIGKQVADGAQVARQALAGQGHTIDLRIIDSSQPNWQTEMSALPPECVVVGGPLRADVYGQIKTAGLQQGRALFNLMSMLPNPSEEGQVAWRFFTSPQDQVDAVLDFTIGTLGINSYGVFAPTDDYGRRMTDVFSQVGAMRGISVTADSYGSDMASWTEASGRFVGGRQVEKGQIPSARASFDAIFLPDGWKNMDMLISTMHYHGAHKKVMIGTSIWESTLSRARGLNSGTYALTIFPAAWNSSSTNPAAMSLAAGMSQKSGQANDWSALGYDFVQLATALNLSTPISGPMDVNSRLGAGLQVDWAGAPFSWDSYGKAHRRLFLFQPARNGMVPLNANAFVSYRSGVGRIPNAEPGQETQAAPYESEVLEPKLDALVDSILGDPAQGSASQPQAAAAQPVTTPAQ